MGMTLEDIRMINAFNKKSAFPHSIAHEKTIFDVSKMKEEEVKKVIDIEAEWFVRNNPEYVFSNIKVANKGNNSVTYQMIFSKDGATH